MLIQHLKKVEKDVLSTNSSLHMELICILISSSGNIAFKNTAYIKVNSKTKKRTIEHQSVTYCRNTWKPSRTRRNFLFAFFQSYEYTCLYKYISIYICVYAFTNQNLINALKNNVGPLATRSNKHNICKHSHKGYMFLLYIQRFLTKSNESVMLSALTWHLSFSHYPITFPVPFL